MELQFGKFKGHDISDPEVTTKYLEWLLETMTSSIQDVQGELARRQQAEAGDLTLAERMVVAGYRALSKEHRDDPEIMRNLEGARAALEEVLEQYFEDKSKVEETRNIEQTRNAKNARNRAHAMKILKDKNAEADDVTWAREILGSQQP